MDKIKLYPGICGFTLAVALSLLAKASGEGSIEGVLLIGMPLLGVLLVGALIRPFRSDLHPEVRAKTVGERILRIADAVIGFLGLSCVFLVIGASTTADAPSSSFGPISTIASFVVCIVGSGMGYLSWTGGKNYGVFKRAAYAVAWAYCWFVVILIPQFAFDLFPSSRNSDFKDAMINHLNLIATDAYQYRITQRSNGGGSGSYVGYAVPKKLASKTLIMEGMAATKDPDYIAEYGATVISGNEIELHGYWSRGKCGVAVRIDSDGKFIWPSWQYSGFEY
jgi:hypothetical protein